MDSAMDVSTLPETGSPIRKSPGQSLFSSSPKLIAACHVLHRLLTPRHPPFALSSLTTAKIAYFTLLKRFYGFTTNTQLSKNSFLKEQGLRD